MYSAAMATRDTIVELLKNCFREGVPLTHIIKESGVSRATFYKIVQKQYGIDIDALRQTVKRTTVAPVNRPQSQFQKPKTPSPERLQSGDLDEIPEDFKELIALTKYANMKGIDTKLSEVIQYKKTRKEFSSDASRNGSNIPQWERPDCLNPRQHQIMDAITDETTQIIVVEGDRRTGKSTAVWLAIHEDIYNGTRKTWGFWASTEKTATKIHSDVYMDTISIRETAPLHKGHTQKITKILDGVFSVNATTVSDSSGKAFDGIWIDETHIVLKDNPSVLATIAGIIRSEPHLKLVLSMNKGTGAYVILMEKLQPLFENGRAQFFTLERADTTHITDEANEVCSILMEASMGQDFVDLQLNNQAHPETEPFPAPLIADAMNSYKDFMASVKGIVPSIVVVGVDPGFGHPTGVFTIAAYREHFYEIDSMMLKGKDISEDRLKAIIYNIANETGATIVCESNSGGLYWMQHWRQLGINTIAQNYDGVATKPTFRSNMMRIVRELLSQHKIHFKSDDLRNQLLKYNPDKDKNDSKGDLADAFIHAVFYAYNNTVGANGGKNVWF